MNWRYCLNSFFVLGLSSGIVAMSGTAVSQWAMDHAPQNTATDIATQNGCPTTNAVTMVKCLQNLPPDSIIRVNTYNTYLHNDNLLTF